MEEDIPISEHRRVRRCLEEELKRRDRIIDDLKKENILILRSAIKQGEGKAKLAEELDDLKKSHKALMMRFKALSKK